MDPSSLKVTPPDENTVRRALLRALRVRGLEPQDSWVSIRVAHPPFSAGRTYTVVIAYQPARVALAGLLRRTTSTVEQYEVGVWVLDESEARELCDGACSTLRTLA